MSERVLALSRETFRSLRVRNFRLFFFGQLVSQVGNWMTLIAQALLVLHLTDSGVAVGVLTACQFAPVLVFGAWAGLVADRSDKRKLLIVVQAFAMVQSFALAVLAALDDAPIGTIYVVAALGGLAMAFDNPARRSLVVELVDEAHASNAVSLNSALMTSARVIGPALAGVLIGSFGFAWAFAADGLSYVAVIAALARIDAGALRRAPVQPRGRGQVRAGLRYVRRVPELWVPLVMMAVVGTLAFNFSVVMPLFIKRTFGGTDQTFTLFFSVLSVGSVIGALATAHRAIASVRFIALSSAAFGVSLLALAAAPTLPIAYAFGFFVGISSIAFLVSTTAMAQLRADPVMRGRVLALQAIVFLGSTPVGGPILGAVSEALGPRAGLAVGAVACLAAGVFGLVMPIRQERRAHELARDDEPVLVPDLEADVAVRAS